MGEFREGIFFGLPEEEYHAIPALSASGIKTLRISPLDFWARARWLNPNYEEDNEGEQDSFAKTLGRAYHKRIIEGRAAFLRCYAPDIEPPRGCLRTDDELKGWLSSRGLSTGGKRKQERIDRALDHDPTVMIWDVIQDGYAKEHEGKSFLPPKLMDKIELAAAMIEKHPELSKAFSGGMPEVTICWVCPVIGVPCKARLDYLKPKAIVDLKTFGNVQGKPIDIAIARELASRKYHIQAAWYDEAAGQCERLIRSGLVHGDVDPMFTMKLLAGHAKTFLFVWQAKGPAPLARGKTLPRESATFRIGQAEAESAKQIFRTCMEKFGMAPWVDVTKIEAFDDEMIPSWAME